MNQADANETYQEAGRLVAEQRHDDALVLLDQLFDAFPDDEEVKLARSKALAEVDQHDEQDTDMIQSLEEEAEGLGMVDESSTRLLRATVVALVGVGVLGVTGYLLLIGSSIDPIDEIESGATNQTAIVLNRSEETDSKSGLKQSVTSPPSESLVKTESGQPADMPAQETVLAAMVTLPNDNSIAPMRQQQRIGDVSETGPAPADVSEPETPAGKLIKIVEADNLKGAVEFLRDNRALSNALDFEKRPVLTYAQNVEMASLLIEAGADYEAPAGGWTPLMWMAGRNGNVDVAKYLIELGAWVSIEDDNGVRPIHQAAFAENHDLVSAFVTNGADINAIDDTHATPLHRAAWSSDSAGVALYLSLGADLTLQNKNGETPYDIALSRNHNDLLPLLKLSRTATTGAKAPTPTDNQTGTAGTRELKFSNAVRLGSVRIREWGSTDYKAWQTAGSAWGTVTIPVGKEVMLMIDVPRLESLREIGPEGVQIIHIRDIDLDDGQLENLYHLKGLRKITLSRTGVSKPAVDALREALPECTVRE